MALRIIGKDTLPVQARGKAGTVSVAVRENGQIGFSTLAGKVFENFTHCLIQWDDEERNMIFTPMNSDKPAKGIKATQLYVVGQSKDGTARYISAAGLFKDESVAYDYKAAGTHSFAGVIENGKLSFELPTEMAPKPKKARTKAKGAAAGNGNTATAAATPQ